MHVYTHVRTHVYMHVYTHALTCLYTCLDLEHQHHLLRADTFELPLERLDRPVFRNVPADPVRHTSHASRFGDARLGMLFAAGNATDRRSFEVWPI